MVIGLSGIEKCGAAGWEITFSSVNPMSGKVISVLINSFDPKQPQKA